MFTTFSLTHGRDPGRAAVGRPTAWWRPDRPDVTAPGGRGAFGAMVVFSFILLLSPQNWFPGLAPLRIALLAGGVAMVALLHDRWVRGQPVLDLTREMWVALLLLAWAVLTIPLSYWAGGSIEVLLNLFLKALIVFWLLAGVATTPGRLRWLAGALTVFTVPLAATALQNFAAGTFVNESGLVAGRIAGYETGLTHNPNDLALMLNLLLPMAIALFLTARRPTTRILGGAVIGLNAVAVVVTFSRAGFLGLATILLLFVAKQAFRPRGSRTGVVLAVLLVIVAVPLLPSSYVNRMATITDVEADPTGSSQARLRDTIAAVEFVARHPLVGAGLGMDILALNETRGEYWKQVHNVYLQYAVDLGLPGLVLFLALMTLTFTAVRQARTGAEGVPGGAAHRLLVDAIGVSLIVFALEGLFHPVAYNFYFYYVAGLALAARAATAHLRARAGGAGAAALTGARA